MSAPLDALLADLASAKAAARRAADDLEATRAYGAILNASAALMAHRPASRAEHERKQAAIARPPAILAHAGRIVTRRDASPSTWSLPP
jgi:hypothetical protein